MNKGLCLYCHKKITKYNAIRRIGNEVINICDCDCFSALIKTNKFYGSLNYLDNGLYKYLKHHEWKFNSFSIDKEDNKNKLTDITLYKLVVNSKIILKKYPLDIFILKYPKCLHLFEKYNYYLISDVIESNKLLKNMIDITEKLNNKEFQVKRTGGMIELGWKFDSFKTHNYKITDIVLKFETDDEEISKEYPLDIFITCYPKYKLTLLKIMK